MKSTYMYAYVDVVMYFVMDLIIMIQHKKYICLQTIQFFHLCAFYTYRHIFNP